MTEQELITSVIRPEIRALTAYKVADASGFIKLDAMENPYTWPEEIKVEWLKALHDAEINVTLTLKQNLCAVFSKNIIKFQQTVTFY